MQSFSIWSVPVFLFVYIAFFAFSQGAVIWVFISEIFPTPVRAKGQTLGSTTHWIMAAVIAFTFPYLAGRLGAYGPFYMYAAICVLGFLFVRARITETKGKTLEEISSVH